MNDNPSSAPRKYEFPVDQDLLLIKAFPIVKLDVDEVTLSMYGVIRKDNKILLQGDYTDYLKRGRDGIKQPDGRFVFPFLAMKWIPEAERKHQEFCFVYNMYKEDDTFLGHRRCDSTFVIERAEQAQTQNSVSNENVNTTKRKEPETAEDRMETDNNNASANSAAPILTGEDFSGQDRVGHDLTDSKRVKVEQQIAAIPDIQPGLKYFWITKFSGASASEKAEILSTFASVAVSVVRSVMSGSHSASLNMGIAGGVKYFAKGLFIKFIQPGRHVRFYGTLEKAMKSAGNELTALRAMYPEGTKEELNFPLMAIVDYCGWRALALSELPIDKDTTFVYGSNSGPSGPFRKRIPSVTDRMDRMLKNLNLKMQDFPTLAQFRGPVDLEAHVGTDGKTYVLDLARVMPPNDINGNQMFKLFRPEFVKAYPLELPTEYSSNYPSDEFVAAIQFYNSTTIPKAAQEVNKLCDEFSPIEQIISILHFQGVNLRNMGDVCLLVKDHIKPIFVTEMLARCLKHQVRQVMRSVQPTPETLKQPILDYFNTKFFTTDTTYWRLWQQILDSNFFTPKQTIDLIAMRESIPCVVVFVRVCELTGIKFNKDVQERINGWSLEEPLTENDFRTKNFIGATVKTMAPILLGQHSLFRDRSYTVVPPEVPQDPNGQVDFDTPEQPPVPIAGMYKFDSSFNEAQVWQFQAQPPNIEQQFELLRALSHTNLLRLDGHWTIWRYRYVVLTDTMSCTHTTLREDLENSIYPQPHMAEVSYLHNIEGILRIALGIARGLEFLHSKKILFRQLTPENVWIIRNELRTKAWLFTPAILNPQPPKISRTCPPDVLDEGLFSNASDIFCFGVILETLAQEFSRQRRQTWQKDMQLATTKEESLRLQHTLLAFELEVRQIRNVAARCMDPNPSNRPRLDEIIWKLQNIDVNITKNHPLLKVFWVDVENLEPKPQAPISSATYNGTKVTVKREETYSTYENIETTLRKGKIMFDLDDKNVKKFFGIAFEKLEEKVLLYWVEEQCEMTLYKLLKQFKDKVMTIEQAKQLITGIAKGLAYIHQNKICLRNLNPTGIWLDENGVPKIASFEQAVPEDQYAAADAVVGEIYEKLYKAPEIATNDKEVYNPQVDIFSLGMIMWEIAACAFQRKKPWKDMISSDRSAAIASLLQLHQDKKLPSLNDVPEQFRSIIEGCWSYEPEKRPTAQQVLQELEKIDNQMNE